MVIVDEPAAAGGLEQILIAEIGEADRAPEFLALRPFGLDRRHGEEKRAGKVALAADAGLGNGLLDRKMGEALGQSDRGERLDRNEVDGSGHRGLQALDRKARQGADAGFAGSELRPIVGLAGAERGHHTHAGDDDDRPAELVPRCSHVPTRAVWRDRPGAEKISRRPRPRPCLRPANGRFRSPRSGSAAPSFQSRRRRNRRAETARRARSKARQRPRPSAN